MKINAHLFHFQCPLIKIHISFGHYHLGEMFKVNEGKLVVLGDWFFRPYYAVFDGEDLSLEPWEHDA